MNKLNSLKHLIAAFALAFPLVAPVGCDDPEPGGTDTAAPDSVTTTDDGGGELAPDTPNDVPDTPDTFVDTGPDTDPEVTADTILEDGSDGVTLDVEPDAPVDTDTSGPIVTCATDTDCDDSLSCTIDTCISGDDGAMVCGWTIVANTCLINNVCRTDGEAKFGQPCATCSASSSHTTWSIASDGTTCDDGSACTETDSCSGGTCVGSALDCDDNDECSVDSCDEVAGCQHATDPNGSCDDGDACTTGDTCAAGSCAGAALDCDDNNPCTDDSCDSAVGCVYVNNTSACDTDGDACTSDTCVEGTCTAGAALNCDDGNLCTINVCDSAVGCYTLPNNNPCCQGETSVCDDGNPCTIDNCDATGGGGCSYENNTANCDDGDVCTSNDACGDGTCSGTAATCDDGNPCTVDACDPALGCVHTIGADGTSCDDGLACSTNDVCTVGVCGGDTTACTCVPTFDDGGKVNALQVGADATAGQALDIDGNGTLDNALGGIVASVGANDAIASAVTEGTLMLLLDFLNFPTGDGPFTLSLHQGELDPANAGCDFQAQTCNYLASDSLLDADTCEPTVQLAMTRTGGTMAGGGPATSFPFSIPIGTGASLAVTVYNVVIEGTVTATGGNVTAFNGLLGGAVTKDDLAAALGNLDPEMDLGGGLTPPDVIPLLSLFPDDIDLTGNGTPDALSIGIILSGIDGNIVGVVP